MDFKSVNKLFQAQFTANWDRPALTNYKSNTLFYKDVAQLIAKIHIMFEECGVEKGDRVAMCSRNQANWAVCFLAATTYGAVPVPLLHEFKPANIHHLVNHSEAKVLFVGDGIWDGLSESEMPDLKAIILINDFSLIYSSSEKITETRNHLNELFGKKYPKDFTPECLDYYEDSADELAMINYTSGTSGFSKGVMIPYRAIFSNITFAWKVLPNLNYESKVVSMLPMAHMYGLMFEVLFELSIGAHIYFLTRLPSPKVIMQALADVKPDLVVAVPLIIEKVYKSKLKPIIEKEGIKFMLKLPVLNQVVTKKIREELISAFGGRFTEVIIGGAAFNKEVESFLKKIDFPYTVGYGMTECAPIISYDGWRTNQLYSCGKTAPNMTIKIASSDPENVPGEVLIKGMNVFLGYYKNEEATSEAFTEDGWFRTGDMGVMDKEGYLYLRGRSKCMILGPSGQNIYPEEIENSINAMQYVVESLIIEDKGSLIALIYPDFQAAEKDGMKEAELEKFLRSLIADVNKDLPNYSRIKDIELMPEDFERTPKKSIKRYLYQRNK